MHSWSTWRPRGILLPSLASSSRQPHSVAASSSPSVPVTVWVKRMDVAGAQYADVESVDLEQTVSKFKARWTAQAKLDVDPALVSLRLVNSSARGPSAEDETRADELDDPRVSLTEAGITDSCSLLAFVAKAGTLGDVPTRVITVTSRARGRQQTSEWHVSSQADLDRHLRHGLLWLVDSGGKLVRSIVTLSELPLEHSAKYYFVLTAEAGAVETATATIRNLASGTERESTRGIADDKLVRQAFGPVTMLLDGEPVELCNGLEGEVLLEADGLLGAENFAWVLLNSAKLTAGKNDVYEAMTASRKLHDLLRSDTYCGHASALAPYSHARVHAFLSASHFLPGVKDLALQNGVTPVECSGARYHVPHIAGLK
jgi:hypothetical protein